MTRRVAFILAAWFAVAFAFVAGGLLQRITVPPPVIVGVLAAIALLIVFSVRSLRDWMLAADARLLLLPHLVRFVGVAFLLLVARGVLVPAFRPIGWGDTIAAVGAVLLLAAGERVASLRAWWPLLAWNVFGLADMFLLIVTGVRLGQANPSQFALFRQLPFGLLPTFFVPLIIATHVMLFVRLARARRKP